MTIGKRHTTLHFCKPWQPGCENLVRILFEAERGELLWVTLVKLNNIRANYEFQEGVLTLFISLLKSPYVSDAYRGRNGFSGGGRGTFFYHKIFRL